MTTFRFYCPECQGAGELMTNTDPRDPASGTYANCWVCAGDGTVTLHLLDDIDRELADRSDDYTPPERTLRVVAEPDTQPQPIADPWAIPSKDAS